MQRNNKNKHSLDLTKPLFSIVIVNWNKIDDTLMCIEHVKKLKYSNREIIVVDNGSTDGSVEQLNKVTGIELVSLPKNTGFTGGHIAGFNNSNGDYILLLNNDAVIAKDYIDKALETINHTDKLGAIGGRAYWWDDENPLLSTSNNFYSYQTINKITGEAITHQQDTGNPQLVHTVSGSSVIIPRSVIEHVGYLHDPFFAYYEETDLFARMKRAGYKIVYDPSLAIWHKNGSSSTAYFQYRQLFKNRFLFAVRNFDNKHLKKFLKNYLKTGLLSTFYSLKKSGDFYELHKGFRDGFFYNLFHFPAIFKSRSSVTKEFGISNYNNVLFLDENNLSIVLNCVKSKSDATVKWINWARENGNIEVIFLTEMPINLVGAPNNVRQTVNTKLLNTHGENLGWLTAKNDYVLFLNGHSNLPKKEELDTTLLNMNRYNKWINALNNSSSDVNYIFKRELLLKHGGFDNSSTFKKAIEGLLHYTFVRDKKKLNDNVLERSNIQLSDAEKNSIHKRVLFDKRTETIPSKWRIFLDRHYRILQLRDYTRWLLSPKISLRLKLARSKNLFLFAISLKRKKFATELKHVRNEFIKVTPGLFDITQQGERLKNLYPTLFENWRDIPIYIICRDRLQPLKTLLNWLEKAGMSKIVLIDNDSLFPPLVKFLDDNAEKYQVIRTGSNVGHTVVWDSSFAKTLTPEDFYIVTDPDVIPTKDCPYDVIKEFLKIHQKYEHYQKVGFGLKIDDIPDSYKLKKSVVEWESQFWKYELEKGIYEAPIDTTFALYKPYTFKYFLSPSIRTGEPYTAHHLPWYTSSDKLTLEEIFYRERVSGHITSWNVDELPERYKKELER